MLVISQLSLRRGTKLVLDRATLTVQPGEKVGLIGRNGAGKTTTLRAILGIVRNRQGKIRFRG